jgi:hypothetical protein
VTKANNVRDKLKQLEQRIEKLERQVLSEARYSTSVATKLRTDQQEQVDKLRIHGW